MAFSVAPHMADAFLDDDAPVVTGVILRSGTETGGNRRKLSSFFETAEGEQVTFIMTQAAPQTLQTTENVLHKSPAATAYPPTRLQAQESCMVAAALARALHSAAWPPGRGGTGSSEPRTRRPSR